MRKDSNSTKERSNKNKLKKEQSVQAEIKRVVLLMVVISLTILGVIAVAMNLLSNYSILKGNMEQMAQVASERIEWELTSYRDIVYEMGSISRLADPATSAEEKKSILDQRVATHNMVSGGVVGADGIGLFDGIDYTNSEFYQTAMKGDACIMEPIIKDGKAHIIIAAPLWEGGIPDTRPVGVVYLQPDPGFLNDIAIGVQVTENGSSYMLDKTGNVIAHKNNESVLSQENSIKEAEADSSLKAVANLESRMIAGEKGFGSYVYGGSMKVMAYAPIEGTDEWSVAITAPVNDFMGVTYLAIAIVVILLILFVALGAYLAKRLAEGIGSAVRACAERLKQLAQGDLQSEMPQIEREDEIGVLVESTGQIADSMQHIIKDVIYLLGEMAAGNFDLHSTATAYYVGDYIKILESLRIINKSLSETMRQIMTAADQVSSGAGQLAQSATELAEGATEQAGAVEELTATIADVSEQIQSSAQAARTTSQNAQTVGREAHGSAKQMQDMRAAMERISTASGEIGNIIGTIEEIADQTNLLALNASIEAARAGEAGRGFAVVASEIGQLAKQSQVAVESTRSLIETALTEVKNGDSIVELTYTSIQAAITAIEDVVKAVESVSVSCENQAVTMVQINQGVEQISSVVQSNSAAAQESSATSEELYAQASSLNELISKFTLAE